MWPEYIGSHCSRGFSVPFVCSSFSILLCTGFCVAEKKLLVLDFTAIV